MRAKNFLDKTLRYLYSALRITGCQLMAIEFKHRGKTWRADTVEEAVSLRKKLEDQDREIGIYEDDQFDVHGNPVYVNAWDVDRFMELMENIGDLQKLFLEELWAKYEVPSSAVVKNLHLSSEVALAGVLSGLSKQLKKMNLKTQDLFSIRVEWKLKNKRRLFTLHPDFTQSAMEAGWLEEWKKRNSK
jgi:hypothetical protein